MPCFLFYKADMRGMSVVKITINWGIIVVMVLLSSVTNGLNYVFPPIFIVTSTHKRNQIADLPTTVPHFEISRTKTWDTPTFWKLYRPNGKFHTNSNWKQCKFPLKLLYSIVFSMLWFDLDIRGVRLPLFSWFPHFWKFSCAKISAFSVIFSLIFGIFTQFQAVFPSFWSVASHTSEICVALP